MKERVRQCAVERVVSFITPQVDDVDVSSPQMSDNSVEVEKFLLQEVKESVDDAQILPQELVSECIVDQIIDAPVVQMFEDNAEVVNLFAQERVQQRTDEQISDVSRPC